MQAEGVVKYVNTVDFLNVCHYLRSLGLVDKKGFLCDPEIKIRISSNRNIIYKRKKLILVPYNYSGIDFDFILLRPNLGWCYTCQENSGSIYLHGDKYDITKEQLFHPEIETYVAERLRMQPFADALSQLTKAAFLYITDRFEEETVRDLYSSLFSSLAEVTGIQFKLSKAKKGVEKNAANIRQF